MNRIEKTFSRLKREDEKALVGFVTAGDPTPEISLEIVDAMCRGGIDILELGVPFSDPTADGPVIQRASARALAAGMTLGRVMKMAESLRSRTDIPIILFSYYNPILAYGVESFSRDAAAAGADGVLVVDLPPEESDEMTACWKGNALSLIRLIAPTTPADRMGRIAESAAGFLYMVSKTGVTGSDGLDTGAVATCLETLRSVSRLPICVGFGVSTSADVAALSQVADGVVIGSAFERMIEDNLENPDIAGVLEENVRRLKGATRPT